MSGGQRPGTPLPLIVGLTGGIASGWLMAKSAQKAAARLGDGADGADGEERFLQRKIATARFYMDNLLPRAIASGNTAIRGSASVLASGEEML